MNTSLTNCALQLNLTTSYIVCILLLLIHLVLIILKVSRNTCEPIYSAFNQFSPCLTIRQHIESVYLTYSNGSQSSPCLTIRQHIERVYLTYSSGSQFILCLTIRSNILKCERITIVCGTESKPSRVFR